VKKQQLVVIGNGMAGARTVEEILARGGREQFHITMLGAEPHGNYNRILLSNVLNGSQDAREIFLHPLDWYAENDVTLHHGVQATTIDREAKRVLAATGRASPTTSSSSRRAAVPSCRRWKAYAAGRHTQTGRLCFRTIDDCHKIAGYATKSRRAVVLGGGLLGLEAARGLINYGCQVHVVHLASQLMEAQLDETAAPCCKARWRTWGCAFIWRNRRQPFWATTW
jgi:nitrite reductase (NADH) large subunit